MTSLNQQRDELIIGVTLDLAQQALNELLAKNKIEIQGGISLQVSRESLVRQVMQTLADAAKWQSFSKAKLREMLMEVAREVQIRNFSEKSIEAIINEALGETS